MMEKQSTDTKQKTGTGMSWTYEPQLSITPARPKLSRGCQTRLLCVIFPKYQEEDELCVFIQSPKGLHTFQFLSGKSSSWLNQTLQALKFNLALHPLPLNTARIFCLTLYPGKLFSDEYGRDPCSIPSLIQLLISLEATSASMWTLHFVLRALTSQMLDTHYSVCGSTGSPGKGHFLTCGGIV